MCVAAGRSGGAAHVRCVETDAIEGVRVVSLSEFKGLHTRIYRPVGLTDTDIRTLSDFALGGAGNAYDLANVIDLARYFFPTPPVPAGCRRRMLALGSGEPSKAICSTWTAQALQSIGYPILPEITRELSDDPACEGCVRDLLHIRHHSLFTPRDFDVSPYFRVVKANLEASFDHRLLSWAEYPRTS